MFRAAGLLSLSRTIFLPEAWDRARTGLQSRRGGQEWGTTTIWFTCLSYWKLWLCGTSVSPASLGEKAHESFLIERHELLSLAGLTEWETGMGSSCFTRVTSWIRVSRYWLPSVGGEATGNFRVFTLVNTYSSHLLPASSLWVTFKWDTSNRKFWNS